MLGHRATRLATPATGTRTHQYHTGNQQERKNYFLHDYFFGSEKTTLHPQIKDS